VKRAHQSDFLVHLNFGESLHFFLRKNTESSLERILHEKTSIKDAIEACGVPHPEVDLILIDGSPVDFAFLLERGHTVEILGVRDSPERFPHARLQTKALTCFIADVHLGKLTRFLRLLGLDVVYDRLADDKKLIQIATCENRALLTRDRRLLMHGIVQHGYYLRSQIPNEQALEVIRRFDLSGTFAPFTRCLYCNANLDSVSKREVFSRLEPLTQLYYDDFRRCTGCGKIYWAGSHHPKLQARIAGLKAKL
jgi:uncharacterized protein